MIFGFVISFDSKNWDMGAVVKEFSKSSNVHISTVLNFLNFSLVGMGRQKDVLKTSFWRPVPTGFLVSLFSQGKMTDLKI